MDLDLIRYHLEEALHTLFDNDLFLLEHDVSERAIAHTLAVYLANIFINHDVDCEYNNNVDADHGRKYIRILRDRAITLNLPNKETGDDVLVNINIYPDIIVHQRGNNNHNLLIIEMKKTSSSVSSEYDYEKLKRYTSAEYGNNLSYSFGVFLCVGVGDDIGAIDIEWFQNGIRIIDCYTLKNA